MFLLEENGFGFIVHSCNEEGKGFSDVRHDGFERFIGVNWSVGIIRYCCVAGDRIKDGSWVLRRMV